MQQTLSVNWRQRARLNGIFRYHWKTLSRAVGWALLILLTAQAIAFLAPLAINVDYTFTGIYADVGMTLMLAFICGITVAHRGTRFLLRFGTSRFSVWLGNVLSLLAAMTAFLLGTLVLNALMGGLTMAMESVRPDHYSFTQVFGDAQGAMLYGSALGSALNALPTSILYTLEWTCLFYLLGCFLRRNRALAITILVGIPMLFTILMLIPAVREAVQVLESASESRMLLLGIQWMKFFRDVLIFIQHEWRTIQLVAAVISLPLSYLFMRETPQP
mgnify:CR=1 FL=1